jgi:hypothetical protein
VAAAAVYTTALVAELVGMVVYRPVRLAGYTSPLAVGKLAALLAYRMSGMVARVDWEPPESADYLLIGTSKHHILDRKKHQPLSQSCNCYNIVLQVPTSDHNQSKKYHPPHREYYNLSNVAVLMLEQTWAVLVAQA